MLSPQLWPRRAGMLAALVLTVTMTATTMAQSVGVTINGNPVTLNPAPTERAGRVFVPLRGVFERLGASVVYANGVINATGNGRQISLHINSNQASINGQSQTIDVAPFIIGASTYVPLRFVAQALGATVNYDNGNRIVAISTNGAPVAATQPQPQATAYNTVRLTNLNPGNGGATRNAQPPIGAHFSEPVDTSSVHITLDGRDVSATSYLNPNQFDFTPPYALPAAEHVVRVTGKSAAGVAFDRSWRFTTGTDTVANYINGLRPTDGQTVGSPFHVSGTTIPGSRVRIVATGGATIGGIIRLGGDTYTTDVTADASNGNFAADVPLRNIAGGDVVLQVQSISPQGNSISKRVALKSQ